MQADILSVLMNGLMAALLLATIVYCLKLNSRIRVLQDSKSELARIIREFDVSTQRATQNINEIHAATMRISENMQHKIDKANYLADDLDALIERSSKLTGGRVEAPPARAAATARETAAPSPAPSRSLADIMPARSGEAAAAAEASATAGRRPLRTRSRAEQELMNLMGNHKNTGESNR
ncbi:MAG: DUF6468 domain-containing protein [Alphaproteobacteria bacterium]|nr:DUF6468 domain-containing protein [Alphaproteobacteria bacterium]